MALILYYITRLSLLNHNSRALFNQEPERDRQRSNNDSLRFCSSSEYRSHFTNFLEASSSKKASNFFTDSSSIKNTFVKSSSRYNYHSFHNAYCFVGHILIICYRISHVNAKSGHANHRYFLLLLIAIDSYYCIFFTDCYSIGSSRVITIPSPVPGP